MNRGRFCEIVLVEFLLPSQSNRNILSPEQVFIPTVSILKIANVHVGTRQPILSLAQIYQIRFIITLPLRLSVSRHRINFLCLENSLDRWIPHHQSDSWQPHGVCLIVGDEGDGTVSGFFYAHKAGRDCLTFSLVIPECGSGLIFHPPFLPSCLGSFSSPSVCPRVPPPLCLCPITTVGVLLLHPTPRFHKM